MHEWYISKKLLTCTGKTVVDLFAGIGYFTLPYLRHAEADHVYACEWNPAAIEALQRNIAFNNIDPTRCTILPVPLQNC